MINYGLIDESITYFTSVGFQRIEVPWTVSEPTSAITRPKGAVPFMLMHNAKCLVGSAEQSFLYLYLKEYLPLGRFQAVTPCFRDDGFDFSHTKYFIKNEVIITDNINTNELDGLVDSALIFFSKYLQNAEAIKTDDGYDIVSGDLELGSYGIRHCGWLDWIYGTGCAEPRLSTAIKQASR